MNTQPEDRAGEDVFLEGGKRLKSEEEMSEGRNHESDPGEASFEYEPSKGRSPQEGQGEGGYG